MASIRRAWLSNRRGKYLILAFIICVVLYAVMKLLFPDSYHRLLGNARWSDLTTLSPNYWMEYKDLDYYNYTFVYDDKKNDSFAEFS
jgi:hypothetical protein